MAHYLVLLYIFFCFDILKNGLSELLYVKNTRFSADVNDILNTTTYKKFDRMVTSSSECAVLCSAYACDTFYYDVTSANCRYVIFMTNSDKIPDTPSGVQNFIISKTVCKPGWLQYGKYCILFSKTSKVWTDAKSKCEEMGSKLVILHSSDLNDFIKRRNFGSNAWVGARKTDVWRWEDNTVVDLKSTAWSPGNPDGYGKCMQLWQGAHNKWDDYPCSAEVNFICQSTIN